MFKSILILLILISNLGFAQLKTEYKYIFLGHTYMGETLIDSRLEELNLDVYDNIWLGGDICSETLLHKSNLEYLQTYLKIKDAHNYFSFGNHDRRSGNLNWFEQYTGKKSYYTETYNGITYIVLDTNLDPGDCENLNKQYEIITNVTDSISQSSHLVLFFHWGIWSDVPGLMPPSYYSHSNLPYWNANCDSTNNNFVKSIYPKLVEVQKRGVDVICVMGDMGASYKKCVQTSDDDILFLASGLYNIKYSSQPDQWWTKEKDLVLEFNHNVLTKSLNWKFRDLDSLLDVQNGFKYLQKMTFDDFENYLPENIEFVQYENYNYKLDGINDSLIIFNENVDSIPFNNEIFFNAVFQSSLDSVTDQISLIGKLFKDSILVEEQLQMISNIPTSLKYYQYQIQFTNPIDSINRIEIYIKNMDSIPVFVNDIMLKHL